MVKFQDIPKYTQDGYYRVDVDLRYLESHLEHWSELKTGIVLEMIPDFQRGHVWDEAKQVAFVEHLLRGGIGSNELRWNCPGWMGDFRGPMQLVDGLQRLTACLRFLRGEISAFGHYLAEYEDLHALGGIRLSFRVNDLKTRAEVLRWYLEINTGGVVHTEEEIAKVEALLTAEVGNDA